MQYIDWIQKSLPDATCNYALLSACVLSKPLEICSQCHGYLRTDTISAVAMSVMITDNVPLMLVYCADIF